MIITPSYLAKKTKIAKFSKFCHFLSFLPNMKGLLSYDQINIFTSLFYFLMRNILSTKSIFQLHFEILVSLTIFFKKTAGGGGQTSIFRRKKLYHHTPDIHPQLFTKFQLIPKKRVFIFRMLTMIYMLFMRMS